jgi:hypothetical protein
MRLGLMGDHSLLYDATIATSRQGKEKPSNDEDICHAALERDTRRDPKQNQ